MRQYTETPPKDPTTDGDRPQLQRGFGHTTPDRHDDQHHVGDAVDGPTADPAPPEAEQRDADGQAADGRQPDQAVRHDQPAVDQLAVDDQRRDAPARYDGQSPDAVADDEPRNERRMDGPGDIDRGDHTGTPREDDEPTAFDEFAHHDPAIEAPVDDEPVTGPPVGHSTSVDEPTDAKPGDVAVAALTALWTEDAARDLRERWREAQLRFVDDPRKAAHDIRNLVNETVEALTATLAGHREQLNSLPTNGDTEQYRVVVQRYRTFFERLLVL
jgi:hypothetical protein